MNTEKDMLTIRKSNTELYNYFNSRYKECSERLQKNQAALFEINIRLEELDRTKNAYISTNNARKNLFSPLPLSKEESEKEASLEAEINKLRTTKRELQNMIAEDEASQKFFNRKLKSAKHSLDSLEELNGEINTYKQETDEKLSELQDVTDKSNVLSELYTTSEKERADHGRSILMLKAFDDSLMSANLNKNIISGLNELDKNLQNTANQLKGNNHKAYQQLLSYSREINRLKKEISVISSGLQLNIDASKPVSQLLDDLVTKRKDLHPECLIDTDMTDFDPDSHMSFIALDSLIRLLDIMLDNVFEHSEANRINLVISCRNDNIDVTLTDNGKGIPDDYLEESPWYSDLHKAHELIYLLCGELQIKGSSDGTTVHFCFPASD